MSNEVSKNNFQWLINISFIGISVFLAYIMVLESPPPLCFTVKNIIAVFPPTFLIPRVWHDKGRELNVKCYASLNNYHRCVDVLIYLILANTE